MLNALKSPVTDAEGQPIVINGKVMTVWGALWRASAVVAATVASVKALWYILAVAAVLDRV